MTPTQTRAASAPIRIYSSREFIPEGTLFMDLFVPFWGPNEGNFESMQPERVKRFVERHAEFLTLTSLEDCDFVVFPVEYQLCIDPEREVFLLRLAEKAREAGKPLIVFIGGDRNHHPPVGDFIFHTALYRSSLQKQTFCMPPMLEDLADRYLGGKISIREKTPVPTVGFCGLALPLGLPFGRKWLKEQLRVFSYRLGFVKELAVGYAPRALAVKALQRARRLRTDVILRRHSLVQFRWGHLLVADEKENVVGVDRGTDYRSDYVNNLLNSDYVLCVRGHGNYSLRLYECLCVGRIPVIVNTDMVFPLENLIDWKTVGVWIEEPEIPRIEEKILEFHERQTTESFTALQGRAREIWTTYISPEGFYAHAFRDLQR